MRSDGISDGSAVRMIPSSSPRPQYVRLGSMTSAGRHAPLFSAASTLASPQAAFPSAAAASRISWTRCSDARLRLSKHAFEPPERLVRTQALEVCISRDG